MKKHPLILLVAVFCLPLCSAIEADAQTAASIARERAKQRQRLQERRLPAELRHLDNCQDVPGDTLDVLRHGALIAYGDEITLAQARSQAWLSSVLGVLTNAGVVDCETSSAVAAAQRIAAMRPDMVATKEQYERSMTTRFRGLVRDGLRTQCAAWAEDVAWSYAPAFGTECAGLTNEPVDALRRSGEFFGQDRWEVRQEVLRRFRNASNGSCQDYADQMAATARILDP